MLHVKVAVSHATCKRWYQKFRQGDFSLKDESRAGRPEKIETDELQALLDINSTQTEKELAEQLGSKPFPYDYIRWERFRRLNFTKKSSELFCTPNILIINPVR